MFDSHSAFVSWEERSSALRRVKLAVAVLVHAISTTPGSSISYPTARLLSEYSPGASLFRGKLYRPWASLMTLTVTPDPAFFALTTTPSIRPSPLERTCPAKATGPWWARLRELEAKTMSVTAKPAATPGRKVFVPMTNRLCPEALPGGVVSGEILCAPSDRFKFRRQRRRRQDPLRQRFVFAHDFGIGGKPPLAAARRLDGLRQRRPIRQEQLSCTMANVNYAAPGNSYPSEFQLLTLSVSVTADAATGLRSIVVTNPPQAGTAPQAVPAPAFLNVVAS